ncbi:MAG: hypothetical protein K2X47_11565 [Bdellovibrionales bacterium]|nr:hypothetical protein [Bdellovibrionales bacterium]
MFKLEKINNELEDVISRDKDIQIEVQSIRTRLKKGRLLFRALLRRFDRHRHSQIEASLAELELLSGLRFQELTEYHVEHLYRISYSRSEEYFARFSTRSPFQKNGFEKDLTLYLLEQFMGDDSVETVPAVQPGSRFLIDQIPVVGIFVPDILLIGRSPLNGFAATNFEVDGKVHDYLKAVKDELMEVCFAEIGIFTVRIKTHQVHRTNAAEDCANFDRTFVQNLVTQIKKRKPYDECQVRNLVSRMKLLTIACWLQPEEIDSLISSRFGEDFNLQNYISLEYHKPYRPKWIRGAKRILRVISRLTNGIKVKTIYASRIKTHSHST